MRIRTFLITGLVAFAMPVLAQPTQAELVQSVLDQWLAARAPVEKITGIAAYVSLGDPGPAIEAFAGRTGKDPKDPPVDQSTLYHMGSTSKSFAAAIILQLEAEGKLSLDDTIGKWLPRYSAWKDVDIRRLLNMTSGIPNYSETEMLSHLWVDDPERNLTAEELIDAVYPDGKNDLPVKPGYHYSNTNYILAAMIAEKASGRTYADLVRERIIVPFGLDSTFYTDTTFPPAVIARLSHGYFENEACTEYQPKDCAVSWNKPMIGRDIRPTSQSWAQAAGAAAATARDTTHWMRAVFGGKVVPPKQQKEWLSLVSTKTGEPIEELTPKDSRGFSLGLSQALIEPYGKVWFYGGMTLGYRTLYVWFEEDDVLITVQTNSQPNEGTDKLIDAVIALREAVKS